jgi:predicted RNase H-like HicB family nuclease
VRYRIETEQEEDGRWIAEAADLPGAMSYGETRDDAIANCLALVLRIMADRIEHGELEHDEIVLALRTLADGGARVDLGHALRNLADRIEHGEMAPGEVGLFDPAA